MEFITFTFTFIRPSPPQDEDVWSDDYEEMMGVEVK